jgi:hypothetical protein
VTPETVVEAFDVVEDGRLGVLTGWPHSAVQELRFERGEETFGRGVIKAGTWATNARADTVCGELAYVGGTEVLAAAIRVMDQTGSGSSAGERHLQ